MVKGKHGFARIARRLRHTRQPRGRYLAQAWALAFIPTVAIGAVVGSLAPGRGPDFEGTPPGAFVFGVLLFSPWIETVIMWPILALLRRFIKRPIRVALASALVWAALHTLAAPAWGIVIFWPFLVFSLCFLSWRKRSLIQALVMTALVHTCQNALPTLVFLFMQ